MTLIRELKGGGRLSHVKVLERLKKGYLATPGWHTKFTSFEEMVADYSDKCMDCVKTMSAALAQGIVIEDDDSPHDDRYERNTGKKRKHPRTERNHEHTNTSTASRELEDGEVPHNVKRNRGQHVLLAAIWVIAKINASLRVNGVMRIQTGATRPGIPQSWEKSTRHLIHLGMV